MSDTPLTEKQLLPAEGNNRATVYADYARNLERLLIRIVEHPQLPVESLQCLRDARAFLKR